MCVGIYQKIEGCGGWSFPVWVSTVYAHVHWFTSLLFWCWKLCNRRPNHQVSYKENL